MKAKKLISLLIVALLCLQLGVIVASAAGPLGSVIIRVETAESDLPVTVYKLHFSAVADTAGSLNADFAGTGILPADMLDQSANADNASILCAYAKANGISGSAVVTDVDGEARFSSLNEGIYLVWPDDENELTFLPYLVYMPTVIVGEEVWAVLSVPKVAPKPAPPVPVPPGPGDDPVIPGAPTVDPSLPSLPGAEPVPSPTPAAPGESQIPQTGINRTPALLLLVFGLMFTAGGGVILIRSKGGEADD